MSVLGKEVAEGLARRRAGGPLRLSVDEVDQILGKLGIPLGGTKAVPVPLRATRLDPGEERRRDSSRGSPEADIR